jgi:hypothetical protein
MSSDPRPTHQVPADARPVGGRLNALVLSLLSFCLIAFGVWLVSAGKRYREEYAQVTQGWHVGSTVQVEVTLGPGDKTDLACASDAVIGGLHCGFRRNITVNGSASADDPHVLQPYNTVQSELLLGAGLWTAPDLKGPLPRGRFSVVCNYHVLGIMRSAAVRFGSMAPFSPVGRTITAGTLGDCVLPR